MIKIKEKIENILSFFSTKKSCIGVNIGSSSVKIVELIYSHKKWKINHFGMAQLPEGTILNKEIINSFAIVESLKTLVNQMNLKNKTVSTCLQSGSTILKKISLQVKNKKELKDQIFWEAEQYIPFDISEVYLDYQILPKVKDDHYDVLLVAAKKSIVESYSQCLEEAGLKAKIIDIDLLSLENVFEKSYPRLNNESIAIIDMGSETMKSVIHFNGFPVFTKDSGIGGKKLTQDIQKVLQISFLDAETLKIGASESKSTPSEVLELISELSDDIISEIKKTFEFYNSCSFGPAVSSILLTGGSCKISGLSKKIEQVMGIPTQILNPMNILSYDPQVFQSDYLTAISPFASIPIGLAFRMGNDD